MILWPCDRPTTSSPGRLGAHLDAIHPTVAVSPLSLHSSTVGPVDMGIPRVLWLGQCNWWKMGEWRSRHGVGHDSSFFLEVFWLLFMIGLLTINDAQLVRLFSTHQFVFAESIWMFEEDPIFDKLCFQFKPLKPPATVVVLSWFRRSESLVSSQNGYQFGSNLTYTANFPQFLIFDGLFYWWLNGVCLMFFLFASS